MADGREHSRDEQPEGSPVTVVLPTSPPFLTPGAARALLRLITPFTNTTTTDPSRLHPGTERKH